MELINNVIKTIKKFSMLRHGDTVLIGLSGGPDSVCLSRILDKLRDNFNISLHAMYINHGLRPDESSKEVLFCRSLCKKMDIVFHEGTVDVMNYVERGSKNIQEAARELRLKKLHDVSDEVGATKIALGHNADDQAETVLMRLVRGSGSKGLSGMSPVRGKIIRPLIETQRSEIEEFLKQDSQPFMTDTSNLKDDYFRNWIRHNMLPEIKIKKPSIIKDICRTAGIVREEDEYLELIVTKTLMRLISRKSETAIELFLLPLLTIERPILRRVLRRAIEHTEGLRGIGFIHIEDILNLISNGESGDSIHLPRGIRAIRRYSTLLITSEVAKGFSPVLLKVPGRIKMGDSGLVMNADVIDTEKSSEHDRNIAVFDYESLSLPLKIRTREDGDYFYPLGFGKRKKLQNFFVDEKIPRDERDSIPIVVSGSDIIWVAGYRGDERFKVTEKTKIVLKLIITKANL